MKTRLLLFAALLFVGTIAFGQESDNNKYIEVTGTSEITLVPDEIHYLIEIKEFWAEEFDGKSKPENYRVILFLHPHLIQITSPVFQIAHTAICMQFVQ